MSATLRIVRVNQLPNPVSRNTLYLVDTPNPIVFDIYLSSADGQLVEHSYSAADVLALIETLKNVPNGIVGLDGSGLIPSNVLPSFVDDVIEYPNVENFPVTGQSGKIYIATVTNRVYRWSGSAYFEVSSLSGTADSALKLETPRTINGVPFDGTGNIVVNAIDLTPRIGEWEKGVANGVATLDSNGAVSYSQLPELVYSVNGGSGAVFITKVDLGLGNVDNTSDINKPVSTATQAAIDLSASDTLGSAEANTLDAFTSMQLYVDARDSATKTSAIAACAPSSHVGSGGTTHAAVSTTVNGFMLATDKVKLDAITGTNSGDETAAGIRTKLGITTLSGSNTGDQTTITGNAGSASKLQTARTINGVSFDGTANITLPVPTVTAKQIPFGSATNLLTANSKLTWDNSFNILTITPTASSPAFINSGATTGQTHDMVVQGHDSTDANGASMPGSLQLFAGFNRTTGSTEFGGSTTLGAGDSNITNGTASGGDVYINGGNSNNPTGTGNGGTTNIYGGSALASTGLGGDVLLQGGDSNAANAAGGNVNITTGGNTATDALSTGGVINFNTQSGTNGNPKTTVSRQFMIRNNGSWVLGPNGTATDLTSAGTVGQTLTSTGPNQAPQWTDTVAVKLATARTINGVAFDGTGNITINAVDSTARIASSEKGAVNGVATLDATGKVPSTQLPSFVDDVVEAANFAALPATGETGKIYVTLDTNKTYRWGGSSYTYITSGAVDSVAGKTGVVTLVKGDVGLGNVDNTADTAKPVSTAQQTAITNAQNAAIAASAPSSHVGSGGTSHANASNSVAGFMSAVDKAKLDAILGTNTGDQTTVSGNAGSATVLQTARLINGVSFNGSSDITINAVDAILRVPESDVGIANGVAPLDANGKLPFANIAFTKDIAFIPALTGTTLIPFDNTTPLVTEGTQLTSITLGPSSATSQLYINGAFSVDCNTAVRTMIVACFRGSVCIGAQAINFLTIAKPQMFPFAFYDVNYGSTLNGTTGVYSIRFGVATAATWYVNRMATVMLNGMMSTNNPVYFEELN